MKWKNEKKNHYLAIIGSGRYYLLGNSRENLDEFVKSGN